MRGLDPIERALTVPPGVPKSTPGAREAVFRLVERGVFTLEPTVCECGGCTIMRKGPQYRLAVLCDKLARETVHV